MESKLKIFLYLMLLISASAFSSDKREQIFNDYEGNFQVSSVIFAYHLVSFKGTQAASGEVVFELVHGEDYENDIYKVSFFPDNPKLFPSIESGFYPEKLNKIDLMNHEKVRKAVFTNDEWKAAIAKKQNYVSKRGTIQLQDYKTSVECDSRQYYAKMLSFESTDLEITYAKTREEMAGC